jgi:hypothetical protein
MKEAGECLLINSIVRKVFSRIFVVLCRSIQCYFQHSLEQATLLTRPKAVARGEGTPANF